MSTRKKTRRTQAKQSRPISRERVSPSSAVSRVRQEEEKNTRQAHKKSGQTNTNRIKPIVLMCIALFFFGYMIYSGGSTAGYLSLVIGLVCGLLGILYFREGRKGD
jgi:hypothetical protein